MKKQYIQPVTEAMTWQNSNVICAGSRPDLHYGGGYDPDFAW